LSAFRIFVAFPDHVAVVEAAPGVEEAYDIMVADNVPAQHAANMAVAAAKDGRDPAAWARHFVELRQAVRE
jgi:hypothetical protein